jgi:hypothetical protein
MAPAAYCMPLRNTELIPARSPILGELAGLGMRNASVLRELDSMTGATIRYSW